MSDRFSPRISHLVAEIRRTNRALSFGKRHASADLRAEPTKREQAERALAAMDYAMRPVALSAEALGTMPRRVSL